MRNLDLHKKTGRTSRMFEAAMKTAQAGRAVYVLFGNPITAVHYERMLRQRAPKLIARLKCETLASLGGWQDIDFNNIRLKHAHHNCVLMVDHEFIESEFYGILTELHRYDAPLFLSESEVMDLSENKVLNKTLNKEITKPLSEYHEAYFIRSLLRGDFGTAMHMTEIDWMPTSLNKPEAEILTETDDLYLQALNDFMKNKQQIFAQLPVGVEDDFKLRMKRRMLCDPFREKVAILALRHSKSLPVSAWIEA